MVDPLQSDSISYGTVMHLLNLKAWMKMGILFEIHIGLRLIAKIDIRLHTDRQTSPNQVPPLLRMRLDRPDRK